MKKSLFILLFLLIGALTGCNPGSEGGSPFYDKTDGNGDFTAEGNMVASDFPIDGILEEDIYTDENIALHVQIGGNELVTAVVDAYVIFGSNGLTVGFESQDRFVASSTDYNNPLFVVNSDNVEFYIDTLNNKGQVAKSDDFAFLINPEEYIEMRVGIGSRWGPWSGVVDYGTNVAGTINNDSDNDDGWGCELFLPYTTFGFSKDSEIGVAFGCRDKTTNLTTSEWAGWIPDPQVIDTYVSLDKNGIITEQVGDYDIASGGYSYDPESEVYMSAMANSIAIHQSATLLNGTYSADMYVGHVLKGDNGLIFRVQPNDMGLFFEGEGAAYYFFFINFEGIAILGKTENGVWSTVQDSDCEYNLNSWNNLKIVINGNDIYCFVNNVLYLSVTEAMSESINVGMRSGVSGVKYKNITVSSSTDVDNVTPDQITGYDTVSGTWIYCDETETKVQALTLNGAGAMLISNDDNCYDGTLLMTVKPNTVADNGLVFRLTDNEQTNYWETGVSYYFFFISSVGTAHLGRVSDVGQTWTSLGESVIPDFAANQEYEIRVVLSGNNIRCYVDSQLYVVVSDSLCTGDKYGIRVGSTAAICSLVTHQ